MGPLCSFLLEHFECFKISSNAFVKSILEEVETARCGTRNSSGYLAKNQNENGFVWQAVQDEVNQSLHFSFRLSMFFT